MSININKNLICNMFNKYVALIFVFNFLIYMCLKLFLCLLLKELILALIYSD